MDNLEEQIQKEIEKYFLSKDSINEKFMLITTKENVYAIPVCNIIKIVKKDTKQEIESIQIENEEIPVIYLHSEQLKQQEISQKPCYVVCQSSSNEKVAIYLGDVYESLKMIIQTIANFPSKYDESRKKTLKNGVFICEGCITENYPISYVFFD